jgi:RNA polymerase sigma-70 factor (ECF subfamily)
MVIVRMATTSDGMAGLWSAQGGALWRAVFAASAGRRDLADDVTAEAFARLIAYQQTVREPVPWLFRTAFRLLAKELRRERNASPEVADSVASDGVAPLSPALAQALRVLTMEQRIVIFLHYYADLPIREVAALSGTSQAAVRVRLHKARRKLRDVLDREEVLSVA